MDFVPDYAYVNVAGEICNRKSVLVCYDGRAYVSFDRRVYLWNIRTLESTHVNVFKSDRVTSLCAYEDPLLNIAVGSDGGTVKIYDSDFSIKSQVRLENRPVGEMIFCEGLLLITVHKCIYVYDTASEEIKARLNNEASIVGLGVSFGMIFVCTREKVIKVWDMESLVQRDFVMLQNSVWKLEVLHSFLVIFYDNGQVVYHELDSKCKMKELGSVSPAEHSENTSKMQCKMYDENIRQEVVRNFKMEVNDASGTAICVEKGLRDIRRRENRIYVLSSRRLFTLEYSATGSFKEKRLGIQELFRKKNTFYRLDLIGDEVVMLERENTVKIFNVKRDTFRAIEYHESEIIGLDVLCSKARKLVFTLSRYRCICWEVKKSKITKRMSMQLENPSTSLAILKGMVLIGDDEGIKSYSSESGEMMFRKDIGQCKSLQCSSDTLAVTGGNVLRMYAIKKACDTDKSSKKDKDAANTELLLHEIRSEEFAEEISYARISDTNKMVGVALYDTRIYVYDFYTFNLRFKLYGHSLPVSFFDFSPDSKRLLSCGMDKLVKLWGLDFGECLKTFHENTRSIQFLKNDIFLCAADNIKYYRKHSLLKSFKMEHPILVRLKNDLLVCSSFYSVCLYKMERYEMLLENESDESEECGLVRTINVCNTSQLSKFHGLLDKMHSIRYKGDDREFERLCTELYELVDSIDFAELDKFLSSVDTHTAFLLADTMKAWNSKNLVVVSRFFMGLIRVHRSALREHRTFFDVYESLLLRLKELRKVAHLNWDS